MNTYQQSLIEEHSQLYVRLGKLENYIYSNESDKDNKVEFANKCIQLSSMRKYEEALVARLDNAGVVFENESYFEKVAAITPVVVGALPSKGNDFDVDTNPPMEENTESNGK